MFIHMKHITQSNEGPFVPLLEASDEIHRRLMDAGVGASQTQAFWPLVTIMKASEKHQDVLNLFNEETRESASSAQVLKRMNKGLESLSSSYTTLKRMTVPMHFKVSSLLEQTNVFCPLWSSHF